MKKESGNNSSIDQLTFIFQGSILTDTEMRKVCGGDGDGGVNIIIIPPPPPPPTEN